MLAIKVEYLLGRAVSSRYDDRTAAEWPPHPGRLFSAMVAAYGERGYDEAERDALLWLEQQAPPSLAVADLEQMSVREAVPVFVPVNDSTASDTVPEAGFTANQVNTGVRVLPQNRSRQPRYFPAAVPDPPTVHFLWGNVDQQEFERHREALTELVANVTYLGHSSSLVCAALCDDPPPPTLSPAEAGETGSHTLRVPGPGRFRRLIEAFDLSRQVNRRIEPPLGLSVPYAPLDRRGYVPAARGVFGAARDWIVFRRVAGPKLPLHASLRATQRMREALQSLADQPPLEVLTGHRVNGQPSGAPHVAFVPLAFVDHRYADGSIMGLAAVLPQKLSPNDRRHVLRALGRLESLRISNSITWRLERVTTASHLKSLQPSRYMGLGEAVRPARVWASVTPMVFGHFPKDADGPRATRIVADSCEMSGLPRPALVRIGEVSPVLGVPPSAHFPTLSVRGKPIYPGFERGRDKPPGRDADGHPPRLRRHIELEFAEPVEGPVLIGSGRYLGMGLCLPRYRPFSQEVTR